MRHHHAEYFVALAERAEPELHLAQGLRLAGALWWYWFTYGYHVEGYRWTQQLLSRMDEAPSALQPRFLVAAGRMALLQSDLPGAKRLLQQALEISHKLGDKRQAAWALVMNSLIVWGELDQAKAFAVEGLSLFRELDDQSGMASAFNALGEIARVNGEDDDARRSYEAAIAIAEQTGNIRRKYITLVNLSYIVQHETDHERAIELLRQEMALAREMKNENDMAKGMQVLSGSLAAVGEAERAARLLGAAEVAMERMGAFVEPSDQSELDRNIAHVRALLEDATFQAAWAAGRKMTLEQAVADALGEEVRQ
jgi:non-specific serine/threonine protein kinase